METTRPQFPLDADDVLMYLEKVVIDKGEDYVYPHAECFYLENHKEVEDALCNSDETTVKPVPSCIVGHVLDYSGLLDHYGVVMFALQNTVASTLDEHRIVTPEAARLLRLAQKAQDGDTTDMDTDDTFPERQTWGRCLELAREAREQMRTP